MPDELVPRQKKGPERIVVRPDQVYQQESRGLEGLPRSLRSHINEFLAISFIVVIGLLGAAALAITVLT
ncbi:hypothetical protein P7B02_11780 [Caulobacter segnis]|uniref:hypothetical protein n=1 Tax=Caulobacter segnis TaxID=88688 RepID=UPI002410052C|nr:hypothetical protein [Caulobacter segnis]MDG2522221.1 hypothetical protein [Caulobacter segnis]